MEVIRKEQLFWEVIIGKDWRWGIQSLGHSETRDMCINLCPNLCPNPPLLLRYCKPRFSRFVMFLLGSNLFQVCKSFFFKQLLRIEKNKRGSQNVLFGRQTIQLTVCKT